MSEVCKVDPEIRCVSQSVQEESEVLEDRNKVARLVAVSQQPQKEEDAHRYLAQHPELWLSGF